MYTCAENSPVYLTAEIRELERMAAATLAPPGLMERAGLAAAEFVRTLLADGRILIIAGPGNNGGDALVVARHLRQWHYMIDLVFAGEQQKLPADARAACQHWIDSGGTLLDDIPDDIAWDLVIDGLFGIGLQRDISGRFADLVLAVNALNATAANTRNGSNPSAASTSRFSASAQTGTSDSTSRPRHWHRARASKP